MHTQTQGVHLFLPSDFTLIISGFKHLTEFLSTGNNKENISQHSVCIYIESTTNNKIMVNVISGMKIKIKYIKF